MAETAKGKKIVWVHAYTRANGRRVPTHERSTPRHVERSSSAPSSSSDTSQIVGMIVRPDGRLRRPRPLAAMR